jgi:hypothetical protein
LINHHARPEICLQEYEAKVKEAEAELRDEEERACQAEAELVQAEFVLRGLRGEANELEGLEEQYWHAANHLSLFLATHSQQRTSVQRKVKLRSEVQFLLPCLGIMLNTKSEFFPLY